MAEPLANNHLSEKEKLFLDAVKRGDLCEVKLAIGNVNVNCSEEDGMSALMFASYKGNVKMVECLLENGANVNSNSHKDGYTALMFATLSGSTEVIRILLEAGAKTGVVNKVNRTAAQLGAFVGRHDCVTLINNFVVQDDIKYYTKKQGFQEEPKLKEHIVGVVHKYLMIPNLSPVKLLFFIQENMELVSNHKSVCDVMDSECRKSFKAVNELFSLKVHLFSSVLAKAAAWDSGKEGKGGVEGLIKHMVKGRLEDGFLIVIENLYRTALKSYPFAQSIIFQQLVKTLSKVQIGQEPSALRAITQSLNGIQSADFSECCMVCRERDSFNKCSVCKMVRYCNQKCQKLHWSTHKRFCKQLRSQYDLIEEEKRKVEEKEQREKECSESVDIEDCDKSENEDDCYNVRMGEGTDLSKLKLDSSNSDKMVDIRSEIS